MTITPRSCRILGVFHGVISWSSAIIPRWFSSIHPWVLHGVTLSSTISRWMTLLYRNFLSIRLKGLPSSGDGTGFPGLLPLFQGHQAPRLGLRPMFQQLEPLPLFSAHPPVVKKVVRTSPYHSASSTASTRFLHPLSRDSYRF